MNPIDILRDEMRKHGIETDEPLRADGKLMRFKGAGDHAANCWLIAYRHGDFAVGWYGSWRTGVKEKFISKNRSEMSAEDWKIATESFKLAEEIRKAEEEKNHERVRGKCHTIFSTAPNVTSHPYLTRKGVGVHGNLRVSNDPVTPGWLAIPLQDEHGVIQSAQMIADDSTKRFLYQGRIAGCYFQLSDVPEGPIVLCEGYATGASIFESTGWTVICAMSAGNLIPVAKTVRAQFKDRVIIIAGDNDQFTEGNPGEKSATAAAKAIGATVALPVFADECLADHPTDFNDLHRLAGLQIVRTQIESAMPGWHTHLLDAADTMTEVLPEPVQVIEGLVCEQSKLIIGGSSKTYKTWLAMDLGLSLSAGTVTLGRQCLQMPVLYVNLELKESTFKRRLQTICHAKGIRPDFNQFKFLCLRGKLSGLKVSEVIDRLIGLTASLKSRAVLVDPVYKLSTQGDENAVRDVTLLFNELDRLTTQGKCTLILTDHFSKGNQSEKDPLDAIRGSSAKGGDVDAALILRKHKQEGAFSVDIVHRELPPIDPFVLVWKYPLFQSDASLDAADMKTLKGGRPAGFSIDDVLSALAGNPISNPITISRLSEHMGKSRKTVADHLSKLRFRGWVATVGEGSSAKQYITEKGLSIVSGFQS